MLRLQPTLRSIVLRVSTTTSKNDNLKRDFCKDYASSSDDEKSSKKEKKHKKGAENENKSASNPPPQAEESATSRLNRLLASMPADDPYKLNKTTSIAGTAESAAQLGTSAKRRKDAFKQAIDSSSIFSAAKRVASLISDEGPKQKQTESELLGRLLGHNKNEADKDAAIAPAKGKSSSDKDDLNLSELIVGMKIDRGQKSKEADYNTKPDYFRSGLGSAKQPQKQRQHTDKRNKRPGDDSMRFQRKREPVAYTESIDLFGGERLGIFNPAEVEDRPPLCEAFEMWYQESLEELVKQPPKNHFEVMIKLTEEGKLWHFPINNEQDWPEEAGVDFTEHIFLEQHLEGWCPTKGPIRHFMELVCVGLSKNPYITAKEKKEHILWYRDYFEQKKEILGELMSLQKEQQKRQNARIEGGSDSKTQSAMEQ